MMLQDRITTGEPFSLKRRNPGGGTKPMKGWGFRNETDPLSDVLLGSPAFLRQELIVICLFQLANLCADRGLRAKNFLPGSRKAF
jgi:hypothetical protein